MVDRRSNNSLLRNPALVALAAWLLPGAGYLLLGQRTRGVTIGASILLLFFLGLLVGGVRALEVPGYSPHGKPLIASSAEVEQRNGTRVLVPYVGETLPNSHYTEEGWVLTKHPLDEVRGKPWSIPQAMVGPVDLLCDWWSIAVSQTPAGASEPIAARSHARLNEFGVLYTAVAGLLNLLAIIDASHRASYPTTETT